MSPVVRVLVVDDSAFVRKVMREVMAAAPDLEVVGHARDGLEALEKIELLAPDVITLDLVMPDLDGLGVLRALADRAIAPAVVVVSTSAAESDLAIEALQLGAIDLVHKPTALATDRLYDVRDELLAKLRVAAEVARRRAPRAPRSPAADGAPAPDPAADAPPALPSPAAAPPPPAPPAAAAPAAATPSPWADPRPLVADVIVVGTSTGGPPALARLMTELPGDLPVPLAMVVHIPAGYTQSLAERLDRLGALHVVEASEGLVVQPGMAVLARAGVHLRLERASERAARCRLDPEPISLHRPSVDVLFASAAAAFAARTVGVVLTGMGDDGLAGARAIAAAGGRVLTEHPSSSIVDGMPRAVREAGLSTAEPPLDRMVAAIVEALRARSLGPGPATSSTPAGGSRGKRR